VAERRKSVFVTGGNSGLGLATALHFAKQGIDLAIFARRADRNTAAAQAVRALGVQCETFAGDVTDETSIASAIREAADRFGGLDYAFNCAGLAQSTTSLCDLDATEFDAVMAVNTRGTFLSIKHQVAVMRPQGGGAICNCASSAGLVVSRTQAAYAAAKFGVVALTKGAALEYAADNIRVNVVCPGATKGEMWFDVVENNPAFAEAALAKHPLGRVGEADEVAAAVLYLCRDATFTTGHALTVDGGRTAG
jgi:NAD(P)-dependent dehydrogenase (short-subunit alcohol dehydrogenase family)